MKAIWCLLIVYAILCILALALIPISASGWLGGDGDGLAAIYAILLAMPWSMMLGTFGVGSPWIAVPLLVIGMAANGAIVLGVAKLLGAAKRG
ncbi:hypothetical protein [Sphingomonas montanisoli]|uniref:Uncharacterized protein n=1 Tax=Sphingomonas montanisoli TaxID=2606412 RepID=A0A5D9CC71_9SPHN|nr:hypothetical protein [Sphingomonas montanisoli]TZG28853.1 hypothetical protein FYJ91_01545 [Sphingomonas montanisoli]